MALGYWSSPRKWMVRGAVLLLVGLTMAQVGLAISISYWLRALFDALEARSMSDILRLVALFVLIFMLTMGVTAFHLHVKRWIQLDWRRWLTDLLLNHWLMKAHHYRLQLFSGEHDNPDGRIAEDIRIATEVAIALAHSLLYSLLILGSFIDILLSVSGSITLPGTGIVVPGYMVIMAFAYAGIGTVFGLMLGRPLTRATNRLQSMEANLRFGLAHAREHSESIALMHGEAFERRHANRLFGDVTRGWNRQTLAYLGIVSFSTGYGTLLPVFPILIAAPQYIAGTMTLGILMQSVQAFERLTSALSWPIDNLGELARCRASVQRLVSLYEDMLLLEQQDVSDAESARANNHIRIVRTPRATIDISGLRLTTPENRILLDDFSLQVHRGERILITGDPAVTIGLFKAVAGLWPWGHGQISLPAENDVMFLPQRPFLPEANLRTVLAYPLDSSGFTATHLRRALECAGIAWLAPRLDDIDDWNRVLPLRAQQRLGMARLFIHQPSWIFIEEGTDSFEPDDELRALELLHRELPGSALLIVSRHNGMDHFYDRRIVLNRWRAPHPQETIELPASPASSVEGGTG